MIKEGGVLHIIDWDKNTTHPQIDDILSETDRLSAEMVEKYVSHCRYNIVRQYKTSGPFFAMTIEPPPNTKEKSTIDSQNKQTQPTSGSPETEKPENPNEQDFSDNGKPVENPE